jgi:mRNA interferase HigB
MAIRIIALGTLRAYAAQYPDAADALTDWYAILQAAEVGNFADVQSVFPKVSWVAPDYLIFNICGGNYRLIVTINFPLGIVYVKEFMTHKLYDAWLPDSARLERIRAKKAANRKAQKRQPRRNES